MAQTVEASPSGLCPAERPKFEPQPDKILLLVHFTSYWISDLSYSVYKIPEKFFVPWRRAEWGKKGLPIFEKEKKVLLLVIAVGVKRWLVFYTDGKLITVNSHLSQTSHVSTGAHVASVNNIFPILSS